MIEFYGELSDACKKDIAKRRSKNAGLVFLIVTIFVGVVSIALGIIKNVWIYSLILTAIFVVFTIVAFIPRKRFLHYHIPSRLIIENETISHETIGDKNYLATKPISRVKKVIDTGDWYYIRRYKQFVG